MNTLQKEMAAANARITKLSQFKTLPELIEYSAATHAKRTALCQFDRKKNCWADITYAELNKQIQLWRRAFCAIGLARGDRVAILLNNSINAVLADQSSMANAYIPVPLHAIDTPGASAFIISDSGAHCLITNKYDRFHAIASSGINLPNLKTVVLTDDTVPANPPESVKIYALQDWLKMGDNINTLPSGPNADDLAAIVYTSGTTGKPKGVMLTHQNITTNIIDTLKHIAPAPLPGWGFLSFLPMSHTFERTLGNYLPLASGCKITFNRSIMLLKEDFKLARPDVLISVPRIYERIYARINDQLRKSSALARWLFESCVNVGWRRFCHRNKLPIDPSPWSFLDPIAWPILKKLVAEKVHAQFGGNLKIAIAGGAALNKRVARLFCGMGLAPIQGYGMTEASPVISGNAINLNQPETVGIKFPSIELRLAPETNEIQVRGPSIMRGYWNRPEDTAKVLSEDGWLSTGDIGEINEYGLLHIRGRIKEIIVTNTGEKVPPVDLELAIECDPLFAQTFVVGEGRPFISLVAVLNPDHWETLAESLHLDPKDPESLKSTIVRSAILKRVRAAASDFPHYALPRNVTLTLEPWTIENGFLTPTLKLKRNPLLTHFKTAIDNMYAGHERSL